MSAWAKSSQDHTSIEKAGCGGVLAMPVMMRSINKRTEVQESLGINTTLCLKNNQSKKSWSFISGVRTSS
jgi:hypothetical protein